MPAGPIPTARKLEHEARREKAITRLRRVRDRRQEELAQLDALEKWLTGHDVDSFDGPGEELLWELLHRIDRG